MQGFSAELAPPSLCLICTWDCRLHRADSPPSDLICLQRKSLNRSLSSCLGCSHPRGLLPEPHLTRPAPASLVGWVWPRREHHPNGVSVESDGCGLATGTLKGTMGLKLEG